MRNNKMNNNKYNYLIEYFIKVQAKGRFTITLPELQKEFNLSKKALQQNLFRLKKKNIIAQIRQSFYVIIPPEYSHTGMLPVYLFIDDLMQFIKKDYYLGLFSAAALHGAGHQQPMNSQIIIKRPTLRNIKNQKLELDFFTKEIWNADDIIQKKTDAGYIKVSSPEYTLLDLIYYHKKNGGINRLLPILEDLIEEINQAKLSKTAKRFNHTTTIQRTGFILEKVFGLERTSNSLFKILKNKTLNKIPLSVSNKNKKGSLCDKWKIIINTNLDL